MTSTFSPDFLRAAIDLSRRGLEARAGGPFGAVIVRDKVIVGRGFNRVTSANDPTAHAEIVAIRDACTRLGTFSLAGCELYASCEPCPLCLAASYWARLDHIYYAATRDDAAAAGFADRAFYAELRRPAGERSLPAEQRLRGEALPVLEAWLQQPDRVCY